MSAAQRDQLDPLIRAALARAEREVNRPESDRMKQHRARMEAEARALRAQTKENEK